MRASRRSPSSSSTARTGSRSSPGRSASRRSGSSGGFAWQRRWAGSSAARAEATRAHAARASATRARALRAGPSSRADAALSDPRAERARPGASEGRGCRDTRERDLLATRRARPSGPLARLGLRGRCEAGLARRPRDRAMRIASPLLRGHADARPAHPPARGLRRRRRLPEQDPLLRPALRPTARAGALPSSLRRGRLPAGRLAGRGRRLPRGARPAPRLSRLPLPRHLGELAPGPRGPRHRVRPHPIESARHPASGDRRRSRGAASVSDRLSRATRGLQAGGPPAGGGGEARPALPRARGPRDRPGGGASLARGAGPRPRPRRPHALHRLRRRRRPRCAPRADARLRLPLREGGLGPDRDRGQRPCHAGGRERRARAARLDPRRRDGTTRAGRRPGRARRGARRAARRESAHAPHAARRSRVVEAFRLEPRRRRDGLGPRGLARDRPAGGGAPMSSETVSRSTKTARMRRPLRVALPFAVSAGLLAFLFTRIDLGEALQHVTGEVALRFGLPLLLFNLVTLGLEARSPTAWPPPATRRSRSG